MFAEPTIDDFVALIDWHISKAVKAACEEVGRVRDEFKRGGGLQSSRRIIFSIKAAKKEFEAGVDAVLGELRRTIGKNKLDPEQLRQRAADRLVRFVGEAKAAAEVGDAGSMGVDVGDQLAEFDRYLQSALRQFDVGFLDPAEPEVPPVPSNKIIIGNMTGSTIQQGSPGAEQTVEIRIDIQVVEAALAEFESAVTSSPLPASKRDELMADVRTIRAQLAKPSPSGVIIQEAGKSLRNVVEGIAGGMLAPSVTAAAGALWSALGLG